MIVFYVSGHGFGHASRAIEVINALRMKRPGLPVIVRTSVPSWFFESSLREQVVIQELEADTGVAQIDSLRLDEEETVRRAAHFYADFDARADAEASLLRDLHASVVVGDVPPLAFLAANRANVPSIALANFTWDWIYEEYPRFDAAAPGVLDRIRDAYSRVTSALRLPFSGGFVPMAAVTKDIPLVARRSARSRNQVREILDLDPDGVVVLASFGGYGLRVPYDRIAHESDFTLIVTDHESAGAETKPTDRLRRLTSAGLGAAGLRYPDLVACADVVVSKPGYGIVSECIANGAGLLYTSRGRFPEHEVFVAEMPRFLRCRFLSQDDLLSGCWQNGVRSLLEEPAPRERLAVNGADIAADEILRRAHA